ncbi:MAG TPA: hypothetical protein VG897_16995 [Terriglobales bacterium]|nr:hypothetical protein [Terriglobales bacterium]
MYGIPEATDLAFLLGKAVEQVCLGRFQTQVHLDDANISIECRHILYRVDSLKEVLWERDEFPSEGISVLLGQTLSAVTNGSNGALEFAFSNGDRLSLFDDSEQYESFQITCGDRHIIA